MGCLMTAKGRRQSLRGGDEWDVASRRARRVVPLGRGTAVRVKRRMNRRARKEVRTAIQKRIC